MILQSSIIFLILLLSSGCVSSKKDTSFDGHWQIEPPFGAGEEPRACLPESDVEKLRALLIRCGAQ